MGETRTHAQRGTNTSYAFNFTIFESTRERFSYQMESFRRFERVETVRNRNAIDTLHA